MGRSSTLSAAVLTASSASRSASFAGLPTTGAMLTTAPPRHSVAPPRRIGVRQELGHDAAARAACKETSTRRRANIIGDPPVVRLHDDANRPTRYPPSPAQGRRRPPIAS